jgi:spermidine synthase
MARRKAGIGEELPEVNFSDWGDGVRYLHLGTEWVQGSMKSGRAL